MNEQQKAEITFLPDSQLYPSPSPWIPFSVGGVMWHPLWALASRVLRHECPIRCWSPFFPSQGMLEEGREKQLDTRKNFQVIVNTGGPGLWGQAQLCHIRYHPVLAGPPSLSPQHGPHRTPFPQNWRWSHSSAVDRGSPICLSLKQVYFLLICPVLPCVLGSQVQSECSLHAPCFHLPLLETLARCLVWVSGELSDSNSI